MTGASLARFSTLRMFRLCAALACTPAFSVAAEFDVVEKSITELQGAMQSGAVTSRQLVQLYLSRIAAYDKQGPALNTIAALNPEALAAADLLDAERRERGPRSPLHGIPILVKDNYETVEMPTTAGSIALATFHPKSDAFMVQRLKQAGAVILGKANMHELAMGITTVGSRFGQSRNPYDLDRNPGGSSGGTGAASRQILRWPVWAATRAGPYAARLRTTISSACAARTGFRAAPELFHCRPPRTSAVRWPGRSPISR